MPPLERREFLKLLALSVGAELVGCARVPDDPIVPAVIADDADGACYASVLERGGFGEGVLVHTRYGHPIRVEGNAAHPASGGGCSVHAQAAIYGVWDGARSRTVLRRGRVSTWQAFERELAANVAADGAGLRVLCEPTTSPTLKRLKREVLARLPQARWHACGALPRDNVYKGTQLAFGRALEPRYDFSKASVVVALDADFAAALPGALRHARDFAARRENAPDGVRLYCIESSPTPTSVLAEHRFARAPHRLTPLDAAILRDLERARGSGLVLCGEHVAPDVQAYAHALNARYGNLGRTVTFSEPLLDETAQLESFDALLDALRAGTVQSLLILGGNPVYDAPADAGFGALLDRVPWSAHLGEFDDETSLQCDWHLPLSHALESWGDALAHDGTPAIRQPAIAPLHESRSIAEVLALLLGAPRGGLALVRETWRDLAWDDALRNGVAGAPPSGVPVAIADVPEPPAAPSDGLLALFRADPHVLDGRYATNAWLQELPKPFTSLTWDNAALVAPATAARLGLGDGDVIEIDVAGTIRDAPVLRVAGHCADALTLPLGYGRTRAGADASLRGFNAGVWRRRDAFWQTPVRIRRTGRTHALAIAQPAAELGGDDGPIRFTPSAPRAQPTLFTRAADPGDYAWGMAINLGSCLGCGACTLACQAENNIPHVGAEQVLRGRIMHWMRIDYYVEQGRVDATGADEADATRLHAQPVPCMHCERAPCELVCPVGATVHDREGLNVQVYNRCIGTRFCANNCPYKVRRFNFLQFTGAGMRDRANPEVTVRGRGVMEKCTYCIQRIETARIAADRAARPLRDGEVVTACQAACPTAAIVFGDLNDPHSAVARARADPRNYALLGELNTAPRTRYLAKRLNPNPELGS